jgi:hypothetical protein
VPTLPLGYGNQLFARFYKHGSHSFDESFEN